MDIVFNRKSQFEALGRLSAELGVDVREDTLELPVALLETRPRLRIALRLALFYVPPLILVVLVGVLSWGWDLLFPIWAIWCLAAIALYGVVVTPGFHHVSRERLLLVRVTPWRYRVREILIDESPPLTQLERVRVSIASRKSAIFRFSTPVGGDPQYLAMNVNTAAKIDELFSPKWDIPEGADALGSADLPAPFPDRSSTR